jgi:hypothetical protein
MARIENNCPRRIKDYWMCRAEFTIVDDTVFKGNKIVISITLCKEMLQKIHTTWVRKNANNEHEK